MKKFKRIDIDLAKNSFQVCTVDQGKSHVYKLISEALAPESQLTDILKEAIAVQKYC